MDMQGALRARLLAAAPVIALVGNRVDWMTRPQSAGLPAITLQTISDDRPKHLKGYQGFRETRVQCDCWASTYAQSRALAEEVIGVVSPPHAGNGIRFDHAIADGPRDLGEMVGGAANTGTTFVHRASVDFIIWHAASE